MTNHLFDSLPAGRLADERPFLKLAGGRVWSYAEILALSGRLANALSDLEARRGDRVAVLVEKSPEALALYFACLRSGAMFIPLNTAYTRTELDHYIGDAEPAVVVCDSRRRADLAQAAESHGAVLVTLNSDGSGELTDRSQSAPAAFDTAARAASDLAAILYTSGTTGRSKGAMPSHANLLSNAEALAKAWRFTENDVLLYALPIFHTHGLFVATNVTVATGGSMIFLAKFDAGEIVRSLPGATATGHLHQPRFPPD